MGFLVHKATTALNGPFAKQLGLELTPLGDIKVASPLPETSMGGVFAVGDCATMMKIVAVAISSGVAAAAGVSTQLLG
jgi:thioredoxin reductase